ncbi:hypothetical protein C440_03223 [Haloferax mucosum ATCC BAA-1512]|uniref:Glycosyltransferase RgtA/B/C/D-like domain-containing protein n=1 Tax=Haloferax mucosum ATCC BAA-1512 TaxID=662479 RepID=M0IL29_9EURY|nr:glycosyltransferase family 39 protein [Haloferax mucosum]ELZ96752.1 hypothetical protein C440_03223 [Haloferax mucosum ATCC BAA-1512]
MPNLPNRERISKWLEHRQLDRVAATLAFVFALLTLPLRFVVPHIYTTTLPVTLAVAAGVYLWTTRREGELDYPFPTVSQTGGAVLESLVLFGVAGLFSIGAVWGERATAFFYLASVVGALVLVQIVFVSDRALRPGVVLVELLALSTAVRFVGLFSVAGFVGIDVWTHMEFVETIRSQGTLSVLETKYIAAPLYHLLVSAVADTAGVSLRNALYVSVGAVAVFASVFVYFGARRFLTSRWALFATALFMLSSQVVRWGLNLKPTSLGLAFFVPAMVVLVRVLQDDFHVHDVLLFCFFAVAITVTNQVAAFILLTVVGVALLTQLVATSDRFVPSSQPTNTVGLFAFTGGVITFDWSLTPYGEGTFTSVMLRRLRDTLFGGADRALEVSSSKNVASTAGSADTAFVEKIIAYIDVFGFLLLLCLAGVGGLYLLRRQQRSHAGIFHLGTISFMALFVLVLPILGLSLFLPGRWYAFMYVPMVVGGALGVRHAVYHLDPRVTAAALVLLAVAAPGIMLVAGPATPDNPVFDSKQQRYAFTESEVDAVQTIGDVTNEETPPIFTDAPYTAVFRRTGAHLAAQMTVPPGESATDDLVVYRSYQTSGAPLHTDSARLASVSRSQVCGPARNKLYSNEDVLLCQY